MYQAIYSRENINIQQGNPSNDWKDLPCLCCQAAGGDSSWAEDVCAAWFLYHNAARLMDNVEDNEIISNNLSMGLSLSAATGIFFSAQYAIYKLSLNPYTKHAVGDINRMFISRLLKMSDGQHQDLVHTSSTLEQYWKIAEKKSGSFFSLATYCGARLATADPLKLDGFEQYGHHLGLLIQLIDDLEDIYRWMHNSLSQINLDGCLPIIYALEVIKNSDKYKLKDYIKNYGGGSDKPDEIIQLLDRNGAVLYLFSEIERHSGLALAGLEKANAISPAAEKLKEIVNKLIPSV